MEDHSPASTPRVKSSRVRFSHTEEVASADAAYDRRSRSQVSLASSSESEDWAAPRLLHQAESARRESRSIRRSFRGSRGMRKTASNLGRTVTHYASLVIAADPVREHREYTAQIERERSEQVTGLSQPSEALLTSDHGTAGEELEAIEEGQSVESDAADEGWQAEKQGRKDYQQRLWQEEAVEQEEELIKAELNLIAHRWQQACSSIVHSGQLVRQADILTHPASRPRDRFAAAVVLEMRLAGHAHKDALVEAMARKRLGKFDGFIDRLLNELLMTGETVFDWFTPAQMGKHRLLFTPAVVFIMFAVYFFTTGEYQAYALLRYDDADGSLRTCLLNGNQGGRAWGPRQMLRWMWSNSVVWCFDTSPWLLDADFLIAWGARYGPLMRSEASRWFSAWFLHVGFQHVLSNMLLFSAVAFQVEEKYGCLRIALLWGLSALGGSFFSAAFEEPCIAVVGASGGVFGIVGLFIADMVMNFATIHRPILRGIMMVTFLIYFIITVASGPAGTSHLSHVGGFLCGLFPAFLLLPNLGHEKWEAILPWLSIPVVICIFTGLPSYFYRYRLPSECLIHS